MTTPTAEQKEPRFVRPSFRLTVLDGGGTKDVESKAEIESPAWFAVTLTQEVDMRYLYILQKDASSSETRGWPVLIALLDQGEAARSSGARVPPAGGWLRAIVHGTVHVLASRELAFRDDIWEWFAVRGNDPTPTRPPY
jgi:hypothetical protein